MTAVMTAAMLGCSTIAVHLDRNLDPGPYYGTKLAVQKTKRSWLTPRYYGEPAFVVFDIPLSFAADTLLLPVDLFVDRDAAPVAGLCGKLSRCRMSQ